MAAGRPRAASVFGILNLIFGGIGFLGALGGPQDVDTGALPMLGELLATDGLRQWLEVSQGLALVTSALTLLLGIALLQMVWWARAGQVWFAVAAMAVGLVTSYVSWTKVEAAAAQVAVAHAAERSGAEAVDAGHSGAGPADEGADEGWEGDEAETPPDPTTVQGFLSAFRASVVLGTLLNLAYYGLIVFFMTRPGVRAAFDAERAAG